MNSGLLLWGVLFGSIGIGFFVYGKKQQKPVPLFCGIILMVIPYMVSNTAGLLIAGLMLTAAPFIIKT